MKQLVCGWIASGSQSQDSNLSLSDTRVLSATLKLPIKWRRDYRPPTIKCDNVCESTL
jgi:hypothetical protein